MKERAVNHIFFTSRMKKKSLMQDTLLILVLSHRDTFLKENDLLQPPPDCPN